MGQQNGRPGFQQRIGIKQEAAVVQYHGQQQRSHKDQQGNKRRKGLQQGAPQHAGQTGYGKFRSPAHTGPEFGTAGVQCYGNKQPDDEQVQGRREERVAAHGDPERIAFQRQHMEPQHNGLGQQRGQGQPQGIVVGHPACQQKADGAVHTG